MFVPTSRGAYVVSGATVTIDDTASAGRAIAYLPCSNALQVRRRERALRAAGTSYFKM